MPRRLSPTSPDEAAALLDARDQLTIPLGPGQPLELLRALGRREDWERLEVFGALLVELFPLFARPGVSLRSGFLGPAERALRAAGHAVSFVPADFRRFAEIARRFQPRVVATAGAAPDAEGRISFSLHAGATLDEVFDAARNPDRLLIVETSPHYPRTLGLPPEHLHSIALEEVDVWIEGEAEPVELPDAAPGEIEMAIARHVTPFIPDGATLQTGIGGIPNAVVRILAEGEGGDYGIHSEMFTDGLMRLHRAGKVANRKGLFDGISIATFAMGSRALYDWLHEQELVRFLPVDIVNDPSVIGRNRSMISINGALSVDLYGQVVADSIDGVQHSGIGGHEDFLAGTGLSPSGRSLLCLPSSIAIDGQRRSRLVPQLASGSVVTSPRHQVDVVVTEHGAAELAGLTVEERGEALAEIAHPDFRDELREAARALARLGVRSGAGSGAAPEAPAETKSATGFSEA
jgi:acyl-CoA hydrolase